MVVNPYLNFNGNTEEAFNFYKSVFGGDFILLQRYKDVQMDGQNAGCEDGADAEGNKILHVALAIGTSLLMGTDIPSSVEQVTTGTNLSICISPDSKEETDRIFNALSAGGEILMPLEDMFWGDYYGMLSDKFQIQWMLSFAQPTVK